MVKGLGWRRRACARGLCVGALGAALSLAASPGLAEPAPGLARTSIDSAARPALWVVGDDDTIIYLFGTFHALDGRTPWFTRAVRTAFDGSDELVLETIIPESPKAVREAMLRYRGRTAAPAQPSPGLAGARTAMTAARSVGLSAEAGADSVLQRAALAAGKPVTGLEQFEQQLAMYDRLPGPAAASASASTAAPDPAVSALMQRMLAAWKAGDHSSFDAVVRAIQAQSPHTYHLLFAERNAAWADWIAARLRQPGIVFVAVGTGHLVGADSVQAKLASRGIRSARVN